MSQLLNMWRSFSNLQKTVLLLAVVAVLGAVIGIARLASAPNLVLLYSGLESGPAGEVIGALEQRGVPYEVRGGAIYVASAQRDELRMTLASDGLPSNGSRGYEILDSLSGFGTTAQMFDAAYWRAKEGELARTIVGATNVTSARVHIAHAGSTPFQRRITPTASVTISTRGGEVSSAQARAFRFLIASAVAGLSPEDVAVIDASGRLIGGPDSSTTTHSVEAKAATLSDKVRRLLEARVGYGNAIVEVSIEAVTESETILERRFDPNSRVAISTESEERSTNATNEADGQVTVASNLPDGDTAAAGSSSQNSETRERINYEVSETKREVNREAGAVRRITAAVLVNGIAESAEDGTITIVARPAEELETLRELVQSAIGFDSDRGDIVTLKSMSFEPVEIAGTPSQGALPSLADIDLMTLIQLAILAIVAIVLAVFVLRPLLSRAGEAPSLPAPIAPAASLATNPVTPALTGEIQEDDKEGSTEISQGQLPAVANTTEKPTAADPVERLRALIAERQEETVEILRSWLDEPKERV